MRPFLFRSLAAALSICLLGCSSVDNFGSRLNDVNANSGDALNDETLLNIIRAKNLQTPNFVGLSQVTGSQTETLSTGLPNLNFGPGQVAADHAYHLTNSLSSGVGSGFTSAPLVSTEFEQGILSPVGAKTLSLLLTAHPREVVFYALVDSIILKYKNVSYVFGSNPLNNLASDKQYDPNCRAEFRSLSAEAQITEPRVCNFEKFQRILGLLINAGLAAEVFTEKSAGANEPSKKADEESDKGVASAGGKNPSAQDAKNVSEKPKAKGTALPTGRFCFQPSSDTSYNVSGFFSRFQCGSDRTFSSPLSIEVGKLKDIEIPFIQLRSLTGFYSYLGFLLRNGIEDRVQYRTTLDATTLQNGSPFLQISEGSGRHCIAEASYGGVSYCVPIGSYNTSSLMSIAQQMRNLQITPADLNTPFTVRLGGGQ